MGFTVDEDAIRRQVESGPVDIGITEDLYTPTGKLRAVRWRATKMGAV